MDGLHSLRLFGPRIYGYTYSTDGGHICTRIALDTWGYLIQYKINGTYMYVCLRWHHEFRLNSRLLDERIFIGARRIVHGMPNANPTITMRLFGKRQGMTGMARQWRLR